MPACGGNALKRITGFLEQTTGRFDAHRFNRPRWRASHLGDVGSRKGARRHAGLLGKPLNAQVFVQMRGNPGMKFAEPVARLRLRHQRSAELRLPTRTLHEHHQLARRFNGHLMAEVFLDQRQGKVDPGGHAGRGPDRTVLDEDLVGVHIDCGVQRTQAPCPGPVSRGATPVQLTCRRQQERPRTHRTQAPYGGRTPPDPFDQPWR